MKENKVKLFCIPYAGGSASVYYSWKKFLARNIELFPVELAGRGCRFKEPLYSTFDDAVKDILNIILYNIGNSRFALLGHSLGSLFVFEAAHKLLDINYQPEHIFFSGMYPPCAHESRPKLHTLSDSSFINEIFKLGGTPKEVMSNKELLDLFLPVIKSDYKLFELYDYTKRDTKFNFNITVFNGSEDYKINQKDVSKWRNFTKGNCKIYHFNGGHFFINEYSNEISNIINSQFSSMG